MENSKNLDSVKLNSPELPSLIRYISSNEVAGFDNVEENRFRNGSCQPSHLQPISPSAKGIDAAALECAFDGSEPPIHQGVHSVSISMPPSPTGIHLHNCKNMIFSEIPNSSAATETAGTKLPKAVNFHSQPMPKTAALEEGISTGHFSYHPSIERLKDKRFDTFKTWSGKLERQITLLHGKTPRETEPENANLQNAEFERLPADRYFDALEGPELETLRDSEEILLPEDKQWPFLLRYPVSSFSICLGVSSQAILWKTLPTSASTKFLHLSLIPNLVLWCISVALVAIVACIYLLKVILYFEAVRREYYHPVRVNFFFSPWIALLFLALGVPPSFASNLHPALWYILMTQSYALSLKSMDSGCQEANVGFQRCVNGTKEGPIFFFAVGLAHYMVLFVTLYQRLTTNDTVIPKDLHPVFFLFSLTWWAYTFPMTGAAIATIRYSNEVTNVVTQTLAVILSLTATMIVTILLITTILHCFVIQDLFPNDIAIAISDRKLKPNRTWFQLRHGSSDSKDIKKLLKSATSSETKDLEAT
ncbi:S-type anion channel SLAH3-like [Prunus yedoensis var. nudiflora]|uniref:S-type anion channel SLAH3-like n=1 Tax=Prunus yedoensis var. nudiflora TaxID=2094558 RepID=A0A314XQ40_PRUYE|nr:S-type anion channel SLAH3-like [Prunus yedoensis var. nudiflora]